MMLKAYVRMTLLSSILFICSTRAIAADSQKNGFLEVKPVPAPPGVTFAPPPQELNNTQKFAKAMAYRLRKNWLLTEIPSEPRRAGLRYSVAADGAVYNAELTSQSGDKIFDLAALECILSSAPFKPSIDAPTGDLTECGFGADSKLNPKLGAGAAKFFETNKELKGKVLLFHRIPFSVLEIYPGFFTFEQLDKPENLSIFNAASSENNLSSQLKSFYANWQKYISLHPKATREGILKQAQIMENEFGGSYLRTQLSELPTAVDHLFKSEVLTISLPSPKPIWNHHPVSPLLEQQSIGERPPETPAEPVVVKEKQWHTKPIAYKTLGADVNNFYRVVGLPKNCICQFMSGEPAYSKDSHDFFYVAGHPKMFIEVEYTSQNQTIRRFRFIEKLSDTIRSDRFGGWQKENVRQHIADFTSGISIVRLDDKKDPFEMPFASEPFVSKTWKIDEQPRRWFLFDIAHNYPIIGMHHAKIIDILGAPDDNRDSQLPLPAGFDLVDRYILLRGSEGVTSVLKIAYKDNKAVAFMVDSQ